MTIISDAAASARENARATSGQFGTQPLSEAEIDLDAAVPAGALLDYHEVLLELGVDESRTPKLKRLPNDRNGNPVVAVTGPGRTSRNVIADTLPKTKRDGFTAVISGGTADSPVFIDNGYGFNTIKVTGGHAVIHPTSSFGNPIDVEAGSTAHLVLDHKTKVSVDCAKDATVVVHVPDDAYEGASSRCSIRVHGGGMVEFASHGAPVEAECYGPGFIAPGVRAQVMADDLTGTWLLESEHDGAYTMTAKGGSNTRRVDVNSDGSSNWSVHYEMLTGTVTCSGAAASADEAREASVRQGLGMVQQYNEDFRPTFTSDAVVAGHRISDARMVSAGIEQLTIADPDRAGKTFYRISEARNAAIPKGVRVKDAVYGPHDEPVLWAFTEEDDTTTMSARRAEAIATLERNQPSVFAKVPAQLREQARRLV